MTEEKKDNTKVKFMLEKMGRDVEELRSSDAWTAMLRVQAKFHRYSASNQLMIWMQREDATQVAGFRQWQSMGRQVQKGEKSIKIFAPMTKKDEVGETKIFGFKLVSVFDISQTKGDPVPRMEWPETTGECDGLFDQLAEQVERMGLTIQIVPAHHEGLSPTARGWFTPSTKIISVRETGEAQMCSTLLHEVGHANDPLLSSDDDRGRKELVAESVSYVLGLRYGLDVVDEVTHYLASWRGGVDELLAVVDRVKQSVQRFDDALVLEAVAA